MKLIDLSVLVENTPAEPMRYKVNRTNPSIGAKKFCRTVAWNKHLPFKKRVKNFWSYIVGKERITPKDFPDNSFISLDVVTLPTHMGTHVDSPYHFGPSTAHRCRTIDQLPIDWFFRPAVRLDMRHKKRGEYITISDVKEALNVIHHKLKPFEIVLIWTGVDRLWGKKEYFFNAPGMSREATLWLIEQGIKVIGIDAYSFDRPFDVMLKDFWRTGDNQFLWPAHLVGREKEYVHIERLTNLASLPAKGFYLAAFPIKAKGFDASWIRAVGIIF